MRRSKRFQPNTSMSSSSSDVLLSLPPSLSPVKYDVKENIEEADEIVRNNDSDDECPPPVLDCIVPLSARKFSVSNDHQSSINNENSLLNGPKTLNEAIKLFKQNQMDKSSQILLPPFLSNNDQLLAPNFMNISKKRVIPVAALPKKRLSLATIQRNAKKHIISLTTTKPKVPLSSRINSGAFGSITPLADIKSINSYWSDFKRKDFDASVVTSSLAAKEPIVSTWKNLKRKSNDAFDVIPKRPRIKLPMPGSLAALKNAMKPTMPSAPSSSSNSTTPSISIEIKETSNELLDSIMASSKNWNHSLNSVVNDAPSKLLNSRECSDHDDDDYENDEPPMLIKISPIKRGRKRNCSKSNV